MKKREASSKSVTFAAPALYTGATIKRRNQINSIKSLDLQKRIIGATWHSEMKRESVGVDPFDFMSRYQQIHEFVERHQVKHWIAIDNDPGGWDPEYQDNLVLTPSYEGLGDHDAYQDLMNKLANMMSAIKTPRTGV